MEQVRTADAPWQIVIAGSDAALSASSVPWDGGGTRVEVVLGRENPVTGDAFDWAHVAQDLAGLGTCYGGKSSPWWYDSDSWFEVCQATQGHTIRDLIANLEGCWNKAGELTNGFRGSLAESLTRAETEAVLRASAGIESVVHQFLDNKLGQIIGWFPGPATQ